MQIISLMGMGAQKWHLSFHRCLGMIFVEKWIWYSILECSLLYLGYEDGVRN